MQLLNRNQGQACLFLRFFFITGRVFSFVSIRNQQFTMILVSKRALIQQTYANAIGIVRWISTHILSWIEIEQTTFRLRLTGERIFYQTSRWYSTTFSLLFFLIFSKLVVFLLRWEVVVLYVILFKWRCRLKGKKEKHSH